MHINAQSNQHISFFISYTSSHCCHFRMCSLFQLANESLSEFMGIFPVVFVCWCCCCFFLLFLYAHCAFGEVFCLRALFVLYAIRFYARNFLLHFVVDVPHAIIITSHQDEKKLYKICEYREPTNDYQQYFHTTIKKQKQ